MSIFKSSSATVSQGDSQIVCTDSVDFSTLPAASLVIIQGNKILVASGGSGVTGNTSTITLDEPYPATFPNVSNVDIVVIAGYSSVIAAVASAKLVSDNMTTTRNALQAIIAAQGTAAEANLVTSLLDTTAGRVLTTGAFGVGKPNQAPSNNIDLATDAGFYYGFGGNHPTSPSLGDNPFPTNSGAFSLLVQGEAFGVANEYITQIAIVYTAGAQLIKVRSAAGGGGLWSDWSEIYHSSNAVNPKDFGVGTQGGIVIGSDNANFFVEGGIYRVTSSTSNIPVASTATVIVSRSFNVVSQIFTEGSKLYTRRSTDTGATWSAWKSILTEDTGWGLTGTSLVPNINNFNTNKNTGAYRTVGGEAGQPFATSTASVLNLRGSNNNRVNQLFIRSDEVQNQGQLYFRGGLDSTFSDWFLCYHSGNTNFNEFFGNAAGDALFWGTATSTANIVIDLPINSKTVPTSLSFVGTFAVHEIDTGASVATGLPNTAFGLQGLSSTRLARITLTASGLTAGKRYEIRGESASSKLTVNF